MTIVALLLSFLVTVTVVVSPSHAASSGPHIADVNLLLPPKMTYPVDYRLQGSDGCFQWSSSVFYHTNYDFIFAILKYIDKRKKELGHVISVQFYIW